ncbi:PAS domain-containing hybrid sensor histidine kinase/response regulator [Desulfobacula sp.]|uniref:hybrid sensor histidine kinase/response regulator n=1 Tax=Desulfobacula sp. TaxID=2593537 RepID=UPI0026332AD5|nr:PAS domain-containing hybrid sensor histidine kinase/response regulator [Desulfobacula sp.]
MTKKKRLLLVDKEEGVVIFKNIFDTMEAIVYVSDIETHDLIYANKKFKKTFGCDDPDALNGRKCWQVTQKGQTGPCPFCTNKRLILTDGKPGEPYAYEFCNTRNQRWYSIVDKAIEWYDKRIVRLETAFDITDKKEHEKLFREFEKAIETSKKLEIMGTLAGGVAHDFNNTLSGILGNINLAQLSAFDSSSQHYLENAEKGVMQAKSISSKLIAFAKGNKPLKTKIEIETLIRQILETNLDPKKIHVSFKPDRICDAFYADADQLKVAIENILQNSVEAMGGMGRIEVALTSLAPPQDPPRITISISDSGCGIPREQMDMIFNPYFTSKPLDRRKSTGLGLSVAWSIITRHGGTIHVESILKKGTTFHIILPVFDRATAEGRIKETLEQPVESVLNKMTARVLVMDDDELILDVVSRLLMRLGYETLVASNGHQAVEMCKTAMACERKIDIALLDFDIPNGMGGFPTMSQLKKTDPDIRGLLITGHDDDLEVKDFQQYGFSSILHKPFSITYLDDNIRHLLAQ